MITGVFPLTAFAEETEPEEEKTIFIELEPVEKEEKKKGKIKLNDTVKFDNEKDTPETFFVKNLRAEIFMSELFLILNLTRWT
ncbi:MAG: hypothetical protein IJM98_01110 [Oscillospiraceae bacterium]|nr:hypothetical protein [Oscillospiraceae bacterium]